MAKVILSPQHATKQGPCRPAPRQPLIDVREIARLGDRLWRHYVELLIIAGVAKSGGKLPPIDEVAWRLHTTASQINRTLNELAAKGLAVDGEKSGWVLPPFCDNVHSTRKESRGDRPGCTVKGGTP